MSIIAQKQSSWSSKLFYYTCGTGCSSSKLLLNTSLFDTNGHLSDIVIWQKQCSPLMRWTMYRWWREGGVIGHGELLRVFSFTHPIRGSVHVFRQIYRQACPNVQRLVFFCSKAAPLSSGRIVPRVTMVPFIPHERPTVKHYCWLFKDTMATSVPALTVTLHWQCLHRSGSCIGTAVERRNKGTPLAIRPKDMARHVEAAAYYGQTRGGCRYPWII